ncbi:hypothetical protein GLOTRDRAFT_138664 [Gloeophyllum trabeum ATCC 11539]|uniref:F-box domain-containing protein n=1 Tax=Gloeophyllum trabeum (strain ATCC 11539 / FP-39264 / Madison 617) TaxID=670483 RepID=S7Q8V0_GLOTA|nr:uncharacterized protein GLOTRDRAFT_138664 [Gloeophyllum trabeum ATCC 11539]EPQ55952.1 hypothetical protein GLOTRDRAFT_138664 [Gloeophyllum trabeum ATCC 11539]
MVLATPPSKGLLSIAVELAILILEKLDLHTLVSCKRVCHRIKNIIDESVVLQYKIELAVAGMEDGPTSAISVSERLQRLKNYTEAWKTMSFSPEVETVTLTGNLWELCGGVLGLSDRAKPATLMFRKLPAIARGIEGKEWTIEDVGFPIRDFKMDPSQDLLVMIELPPEPPAGGFVPCKIHLRTLNGNKPHPSVSDSVMVTSIRTPHDDSLCFTIKLCGDRLGIMLEYLRHEDHRGDVDIMVYNWRTAASLFRIYGIDSPIEAYTFLSEEYILLGIAEDCVPRLEVYKLYEDSNITRREWNGQDYFCAFAYGRKPHSIMWGSMVIQGEAPTSWSQSGYEDIPFFTSPSRRVVGVMFDDALDADADWSHHTRHLIHLPKLLSLVSLRPEQTGTTYVWPFWANDTALSVPELDPSPIWWYWIHGTKVLHSFAQEKLVQSLIRDFHYVEVMDLNPILLKRESSRHGDTGVNDSRIERYVKYKAMEVLPAMGKMISEDNLILVEDKVEEDAGDANLFIYTL